MKVENKQYSNANKLLDIFVCALSIKGTALHDFLCIVVRSNVCLFNIPSCLGSFAHLQKLICQLTRCFSLYHLSSIYPVNVKRSLFQKHQLTISYCKCKFLCCFYYSPVIIVVHMLYSQFSQYSSIKPQLTLSAILHTTTLL